MIPSRFTRSNRQWLIHSTITYLSNIDSRLSPSYSWVSDFRNRRTHIYRYNTNSVCVCVSVKYRRPNGSTDHDQIWHAYADRSGNGSYLNKLTPPPPKGVEVGILGGNKIKSPGNVKNCPENQQQKLDPPHPGFRGVGGSTFQKPGKFINCRENRYKKISPVEILGDPKIKSPGNAMNCREK